MTWHRYSGSHRKTSQYTRILIDFASNHDGMISLIEQKCCNMDSHARDVALTKPFKAKSDAEHVAYHENSTVEIVRLLWHLYK